MRVGDRVQQVGVVGSVGRVLQVMGDRVLVRWAGYPSSPLWVEAAQLLPSKR